MKIKAKTVDALERERERESYTLNNKKVALLKVEFYKKYINKKDSFLKLCDTT